MTNEDLIMTLSTTGGTVRIYPENGLWTVEVYDTEPVGKPRTMVVGLDSFGPAMVCGMRAIYNPTAVLDSEKTLKERVLNGLDGLEDYRTKALAEGL